MKSSLNLSRREKLLLGLLSSALLFSFSFSYGAVDQSRADSIMLTITKAGNTFPAQEDRDAYYKQVYKGLSDAIDMLGVVRNSVGAMIGAAPVTVPPVTITPVDTTKSTSQSTPKNFCKNGAGPHIEINIDDNARFFSTGPRDGAGGDLFRTYGSGDVFVIKINVPAGYKYTPPAGRPDILPGWVYTNSPVTQVATRTVSLSRNLCDFNLATAQMVDDDRNFSDGVVEFHIKDTAWLPGNVALSGFSVTPGYSYYLNVKNGPCKTSGNSTGYQGCHFDSQFKNWTGVNRAPGLVPGGSTTGTSGGTGGGTSTSSSPWAPFGATDPWCPTSVSNGNTLYPKAAKWNWKNIGNVFFNDYTLPATCTSGDEFLLHEGTTGQSCATYRCK